VVGLFVRLNEERGLTPSTTSLEVLDEAAVEVTGAASGLSVSDFDSAMDAVEFVKRRTLYGGPSPESLAIFVGEARGELAADETWLEAKRQQVTDAEAALEAAIDAVLR